MATQCKLCKGSGQMGLQSCPHCKGVGSVEAGEETRSKVLRTWKHILAKVNLPIRMKELIVQTIKLLESGSEH